MPTGGGGWDQDEVQVKELSQVGEAGTISLVVETASTS